MRAWKPPSHPLLVQRGPVVAPVIILSTVEQYQQFYTRGIETTNIELFLNVCETEDTCSTPPSSLWKPLVNEYTDPKASNQWWAFWYDVLGQSHKKSYLFLLWVSAPPPAPAAQGMALGEAAVKAKGTSCQLSLPNYPVCPQNQPLPAQGAAPTSHFSIT